MATKKTAEKKNATKGESSLDKYFELAFNKSSKVFEQLVKNLEKEYGVGKKEQFVMFSQAFQGFSQNNVSKMEGFTLEVQVRIKVSRLRITKKLKVN